MQCLSGEETQKEKSKGVGMWLAGEWMEYPHFHGVKVAQGREAVHRNPRQKEARRGVAKWEWGRARLCGVSPAVFSILRVL